MTDDGRLTQLRRELDELDEAPLSSHPATLERVHRALVDELDALADVDAADPTGGPARADEPPVSADDPAEALSASSGQEAPPPEGPPS